MKSTVKFQLSLMMFLQFFIWGGWFVTLGTFLGNNLNATGGQIAMAFSTQSWGAIIAPVFIGLIADRFFNAEKILGFLHLLGGGLLYLMSITEDFSVFYPYVFVYMLLYMPTLALVNSVSFNQMKDTTSEFPLIRTFGTVGWIVSGLVISFVFGWDAQDSIADGALSNTFLMVAMASLMLGFFSFSLPKTPPYQQSQNKFSLKNALGWEAVKLLNDRNFLLFFIASILICIPLAFYYQQANPFLVSLKMDNPTAKMSLGQVSEVLFMLLLPLFFARFGLKKTILVGMMAWVIRYLLFAFGDAGEHTYMLIVGILLHGICYDFFFVSGQIYTDFKAGEKVKSAAQGLITLATYGVGMLIGFWIAGKISDTFILSSGAPDWKMIWLIPSFFALLVFVLFSLIFKNEKISYNNEPNTNP
ncbi:MAG: MFS transporter [Flavobacteriaceae bacterium]|nr:MFS transporter [Flavobacteriaceae bacterium]MDG1967989.1 MFS transporter [Flavobacteriaceae bacterium]|tara:strand:- start:178 stop:1425 length:1248 start_codon:yes stop_codon:yes gene_type:complete